MHEHTIPESLIEQIRTGKAALVVGAGIGVPCWKQLLERMTKALETRGREGDDAATKDLEKLLHKGSLVRAVGFLARALGEETCDRIVEETWAAPVEMPALPKALATAAVPPRVDDVPRRRARARVRDRLARRVAARARRDVPGARRAVAAPPHAGQDARQLRHVRRHARERAPRAVARRRSRASTRASSTSRARSCSSGSATAIPICRRCSIACSACSSRRAARTTSSAPASARSPSTS